MAANKQPKNTQKCRRLTKNSRKMLNYLHMNYVCLWYVYTCHTQTKQTTNQIPMRKVVRQWIWARVIDFRLMDWLLSENEWRVYFTLSLLPAARTDWFMLFCDDKQNNDIQQHILQHILCERTKHATNIFVEAIFSITERQFRELVLHSFGIDVVFFRLDALFFN